MSTRVVELPLSALTLDPRCQLRESLSEDWAAELAEVLLPPSNGTLKEVVAFWDGSKRWLADGFHRHRAHELAGKKSIRCELRNGTLRDAILYAAGCNAVHKGLIRSGDDKRKSVRTLLEDAEWSQWNDREIARRCSVSGWLVAQVRQELSARASQMRGARLVERGGTVYEMATGGDDQDEDEDTDLYEPTAEDWLREAREGLAVAIRALGRLGDKEALGHARAALEVLNRRE